MEGRRSCRSLLEHSEAAVIDLSVRNSEIFIQNKKDVQSLGEAMWSAKSSKVARPPDQAVTACRYP